MSDLANTAARRGAQPANGGADPARAGAATGSLATSAVDSYWPLPARFSSIAAITPQAWTRSPTAPG